MKIARLRAAKSAPALYTTLGTFSCGLFIKLMDGNIRIIDLPVVCVARVPALEQEY